MLKRLLLFWAHRSRVEVISGHGADTAYLVRYHLINNRFFKLYLHYFLRPDLDDPHDHPWRSLSLGIQGEYTEEIYDWRTRTFQVFRRKPWSFVPRSADLIHRIKVDTEYAMDVADNWRKAPMTLFFTCGKTREWGFINNPAVAPVWEHWKSYLAKR